MATVTTRAGKGSPLTNTEVDANFTNLNTDKLELSGGALTGAVTTTSTIDGRDVSVDGTKLDTVATSANNYTHPSNHAISVITGLQTALDGKIDDSQVLTNVPSGAVFTDTNTVYTHPSNHAISVITGLQTALDGKVDDSQVLTNVPSGALFTDTNTVYTHPTTAGNKHVPTGGAAGQFLKYSASGTAVWATPSYTTNTDTDTWRSISDSVSSTSSVISASSAAVKLAYDNVPTHSHSYQAADADLLAIGGLTGTSGYLKKTAADTWILDTSTFAASSHTHSYLPLAGGNMTGALQMSGATVIDASRVVTPSYLNRSSSQTGHLVGSYNNVGSNDTHSNPIYTIGSSYNPAQTTLGNMYGIGYASSAASFISFSGASNWGMYVAADGDARVWLDGSTGNICSKGSVFPEVGYGRTAHHTGYLVGGYNNIGGSGGKSSPIYSIGSAYTASDTSLGNLYGIGYTTYSNALMGATIPGGNDWGMYVAAGGIARVWLDGANGNIGSMGSVYSTGGYRVGTTEVIDASRNLTNIGGATIAGDASVAGFQGITQSHSKKFHWNSPVTIALSTNTRQTKVFRVYYTPAHWNNGINLEVELKSSYYEQHSSTYSISQGYSQSEPYVYCKSRGTNEHKIKLVQGTSTAYGHNYSGQPVYYTDFYIWASAYMTGWVELTHHRAFGTAVNTGIWGDVLVYNSNSGLHTDGAATPATIQANFGSGGLIGSQDIYTQKMYDSGNTAYYSDPASSSILSTATIGGVQIGGASGYASYPRIRANSSSLFLDPADGNNIYIGWYSGGSHTYSEGTANFQSYRDRSNSAYYADPASTSNLLNLDVNENTNLATGGNGRGVFVSYNSSSSYKGYFDWRTLQLGNNGVNNILFGNTAAGGYAKFWVNSTAISQTGGTSGINTLTLLASGEMVKEATERFTIKSHSNGWTGGMRFITQDGNTTFQMHPDNNGLMMNDGEWAFTTGVRSPKFYNYTDTSYYMDLDGTSELSTLKTHALAPKSTQINYTGVDNGTFSFTNAGGGSANFTNRGGRILTSNASGWHQDGEDPVISIVDSHTGTDINSAGIGMILHNEQSTNSAYSPGVLFTAKSTSGSYNSMYAGIYGRKTSNNTGVDTNWNTGELHFFSVGTGYVTSTPDLRLANHGEVHIKSNVRAPIFYDSNNTAYYTDPASTSNLNAITAAGNITTPEVSSTKFSNAAGGFLFRAGSGAGTTRHINLADSTTDPSNIDNPAGTGISWGERSDNNPYYMIYPDKENINGDYSKLVIAWHTGLKLGASSTYGGTRFYNNSPFLGSEIFSVGKADNHVRASYNFYSQEVHASVRVNAPAFYDSNDTSYYADPASASTSLRTVGDWRSDASAWSGEFAGKIQYHSNNWYLQASGEFIFRNGGGTNVHTTDTNGHTTSIGSLRAPIFYDSNDTGYYTDNASTSRFSVAEIHSRLPLQNNVALSSTTTNGTVRIVMPGGGAHSQGGSTATGGIKIVLPVGMTNGMLTIKGIVYEYDTNKSFEFCFGGYNYPSGLTWAHNAYGYITTSPLNTKTYAIRFGYDSNSKACVYIGETNSTWSYPQVSITECTVGYSSVDADTWDNGWDVTFATTFENVTKTIAAADTRASVQRNAPSFASMYYDNDNTAYYTDPASTATSAKLAGTVEVPKLYLNGGNYEGQIVFGATDSWRTGIRQHDDGDAELRVWAKNSSGRIYIATGYDGQPTSVARPTDGLVVDGNSVGIGDFSGSGAMGYKLHVKGTSLVTGTITSSSDVRAPIYYDSNDTNYYLDPGNSGTSLRINGDILCDQGYGKGMVGVYSSYRLQHVFSMGAAYRLAADGSTSGNMYGMAWSHPNAGAIGGANNLTDHGLLIINNGSFAAAMSTSVVASSYVKGTQFYDYNNTGYYVDPASASDTGSRMRGGVLHGPNTSWSAYLHVGGNGNNQSYASVAATSGNLHLDGKAGYNVYLAWYSQTPTYVGADIRATLYYDRNDTTYYGDFASTGTSLKIAGSIIAAGNITAYSDRRVKENIEPITNAISKVQQLNGVTFNRTDLENKTKRYAGLIAQDIEAVLPEAVEGNAMKRVDYSATIGLLVEAIKELTNKVETLETQLSQKEII